MENKKIVTATLAATMSLSMIFSSCSLLNPLSGNGTAEIRDFANAYFAKLLRGKNTASYVDASDVKNPDLTDDQWDALMEVTASAKYEITNIEGGKKDKKAKVTYDVKYVDAEDLAIDLGDISFNDFLDEIGKAKADESDKIALDMVFVDGDWLVTEDSDKDAKAFLKGIVDDLDFGSKPSETKPSETTEATTEETTTATSETTTTAETSETTTTAETSETSESSETSETTPADTSVPDKSGAKYVNFDEMNFYINGKKYTLGKVTLQQLIDDGVPFDENDIKNATTTIQKNYQASFSVELGKYQSASIYILNDSDKDKPANECMVNEVYLPQSSDKKQDILSFDFPLNLTPEDIKANSGEPDEDNTYDSDDGKYHSYKMEYKKKSKKYLLGSKYSFEFVNGELRYIYVTYIP